MALIRSCTLPQIFTLLGLVLQLSLYLRSDDAFQSRPFIEDTFYTLTVSANIAAGNGISIDGVHPTNGIQPLIAFLYVPLFLLVGGDRIAVLRLVLALQQIIFVAAAFAVAWFASTLVLHRDKQREVFWITAMLFVWSLPLLNHLLNGLETGLTVALAFISVAYYTTRIANSMDASVDKMLLLGALLGITVLSRIDTVFLVAAILITLLAERHKMSRSSANAPSGARTLLDVILIGGTAVLVSAPWWIYNVVVFGSLMPISGQAQASLMPDQSVVVVETLKQMSDAFVITTHLPIGILNTFALTGTFILIAVVLLGVVATGNRDAFVRSWYSWREWWNPWRALPMLIYTVSLLIYYSFFFGAPHFNSRYLISWRIICSLMVVSFLYVLWHTAGRHLRTYLATVIAIAMIITIGGFSYHFTNTHGNASVERVDWGKRMLLQGETVAMFQSGTVGYFLPNVVNLDGKVNSAALVAMQAGRLAEYVDTSNFEWVMDWPELVVPLMSQPRLRTQYRAVDTLNDRSIIYRRIHENQ